MEGKKITELMGPDEKTRFSQCLIQFCQEYFLFSDFVHITGRLAFNIDGIKVSIPVTCYVQRI